MNYTLLDTETTGLSKRYDYPLTFAAKTYNADFELIDEISLQCGLRPGVIPSPYAIGTNKLKISDLKISNLSFFEMMREINKYIQKHSPSYIIGHNSLKYDEEILRSCFYLSLLPTYITQLLGNERADTMNMAIAASVFIPGAITVELNGKNVPKYTLESLAKINGLIHEEAHTALSDANACAELTKKIMQYDRQFFDDYMATTSKKKVERFLKDNLAFCHTPKFGKRYILTKCAMASASEVISFDLKADPADYFDLSAKELSRIIREKDSPFFFIKTNQHPGFMSMTYKKHMEYDLSNELLMDRAGQIAENEKFQQACSMAAKLSAPTYPEGATVEEKIYSGGFPDDFDQLLMKKFHEGSWNERVEIAQQFSDKRFEEIAERIIYEFNPALLRADALTRVERTIHTRLHDIDNKPRSLHQSIQELEDYKTKNPGVLQQPLQEYEEYLKAI